MITKWYSVNGINKWWRGNDEVNNDGVIINDEASNGVWNINDGVSNNQCDGVKWHQMISGENKCRSPSMASINVKGIDENIDDVMIIILMIKSMKK